MPASMTPGAIATSTQTGAYTTATFGGATFFDGASTPQTLLLGDHDNDSATVDIPILRGTGQLVGELLTIALTVPPSSEIAYDHDDDSAATTQDIIRAEVKRAINTFLRSKPITVIFYNVTAAVFITDTPGADSDQFNVSEGRTAETLKIYVTDADPVQVDDARGMLDISVRPRRQSHVNVRQTLRKTGAVTNIEVTYGVEEAINAGTNDKYDNCSDRSTCWLDRRSCKRMMLWIQMLHLEIFELLCQKISLQRLMLMKQR